MGSKNGNNITLLKFELHKEVKDSQYNSRTAAILGAGAIVAMGCTALVAILAIVFFRPRKI